MSFEEKVGRAYTYAQDNAYRFFSDVYRKEELVQNSIIKFIGNKKKIQSFGIEGKAVDSWMYTIMKREKSHLFDLKYKSSQQNSILDKSLTLVVDAEDRECIDIESDQDLNNMIHCAMLRKTLWGIYKKKPLVRYRVFYYRLVGYKNTEVAALVDSSIGSVNEMYRLARLDLQKIIM